MINPSANQMSVLKEGRWLHLFSKLFRAESDHIRTTPFKQTFRGELAHEPVDSRTRDRVRDLSGVQVRCEARDDGASGCGCRERRRPDEGLQDEDGSSDGRVWQRNMSAHIPNRM